MIRLIFVKIFIIFLLFFTISCSFFPIYGKRKYINFIGKNLDNSISLQLDGFYYCEFEQKVFYSDTLIKFIHPMFLYNDGTVRSYSNIDSYIYSHDRNNISLDDNTYENAHKYFIKYLNDPSYSGDKGSRPVGWGQYRVIGDTLLIKYFDYGPSNFGDLTLCESKSIILNDTTFKQLEFGCLKGYGIKEERVYKFKKYSPKPDSTNWTHDLQKE